MLETLSTLLVALAGVYFLIGLLFAVPFAWRGAPRLDAAAEEGSLGFRILILPGAAALWPVLARKWRAALRDDP